MKTCTLIAIDSLLSTILGYMFMKEKRKKEVEDQSSDHRQWQGEISTKYLSVAFPITYK